MYTFRRAISNVSLTSFKAINKALVLLSEVITIFALRKSSYSTLNFLKNRILISSFYQYFTEFGLFYIEIDK